MTKGIYSIKNLVIDKRYVGSALDIHGRWKKHQNDLIRGRHHSKKLQADWRKYGSKCFRLEILEIINDPTNTTLSVKEQFWIDRYNSYFDGYNELLIASRPQTYTDEERRENRDRAYWFRRFRSALAEPQYVEKIRSLPLQYDQEKQAEWETINSAQVNERERLREELLKGRGKDRIFGAGAFMGVVASAAMLGGAPAAILGFFPALILGASLSQRKSDKASNLEYEIKNINATQPKKLAEVEREKLVWEERKKRSRPKYSPFLSHASSRSTGSRLDKHRVGGGGAKSLLEVRAEQGDAAAQCNLGLMYDEGNFAHKDKRVAFSWYKKAAEQGLAEAQSNLGAMYEHGEGVGQNLSEALKWYRLAAKSGNAVAQYNLAGLYDAGRGVSRNEEEALKWYREAAKQGDRDAIKRIKEKFPDDREYKNFDEDKYRIEAVIKAVNRAS